jgi:cytochrome c oxidase assembly protein subunit 11
MADLSHSTFANAARRNKRIGMLCLGLVAGMVGLAYASVPLYAMFCSITGFGGTPGKAESNPKGIIAREMSVRFDSNVSSELNSTVQPAASVTDRIGAVDTFN